MLDEGAGFGNRGAAPEREKGLSRRFRERARAPRSGQGRARARARSGSRSRNPVPKDTRVQASATAGSEILQTPPRPGTASTSTCPPSGASSALASAATSPTTPAAAPDPSSRKAAPERTPTLIDHLSSRRKRLRRGPEHLPQRRPHPRRVDPGPGRRELRMKARRPRGDAAQEPAHQVRQVYRRELSGSLAGRPQPADAALGLLERALQALELARHRGRGKRQAEQPGCRGRLLERSLECGAEGRQVRPRRGTRARRGPCHRRGQRRRSQAGLEADDEELPNRSGAHPHQHGLRGVTADVQPSGGGSPRQAPAKNARLLSEQLVDAASPVACRRKARRRQGAAGHHPPLRVQQERGVPQCIGDIQEERVGARGEAAQRAANKGQPAEEQGCTPGQRERGQIGLHARQPGHALAPEEVGLMQRG